VDKEGGGILTLWDNKKFTCSRLEEGKGFILTEGMYKSGDSVVGVKVAVLNIYAPCSNSDKVVLWRDLECLLGNGTAYNRCLIGDFNSFRVASERKGITSGTVNKYEMASFNDFIKRCALRDIPAVGRQFTWYIPNGTARSRLDRALVSDEWLQQCQGSKQYVQGRQVSDHCALVIKNCILDWGPKPFRTFDVWQYSSGFKKVVEKGWSIIVFNGCGMEILKEKCKRLKLEIKRWNKEVYARDKNVRQTLIAKIEALDQCDDDGNLTEEKRIERVELLSQLRIMEEKEAAMISRRR